MIILNVTCTENFWAWAMLIISKLQPQLYPLPLSRTSLIFGQQGYSYLLPFSHFPPYSKLKTFFLFYHEISAVTVWSTNKKNWKAHSTKLINSSSWLLHWCISDKKETRDEKWHFSESHLNLQKTKFMHSPTLFLCVLLFLSTMRFYKFKIYNVSRKKNPR